ncbi:MAG: hypothetical protein Q8Q84_12510 [Hydrogenophaga sp.]|nr:hypothetical protein [Hydrogenophaga sp.]MDP3924171.1 hypothetical protein [Hydrogenophaga sp.]
MQFDSSLLSLAGFAFAHAVWSVSDLPEGELLVPLALVEKSGQRQLLRFEAESQEEAIAEGKETLARHEAELDAWVFVREGQIQQQGTVTDVLTVEAKSRGAQAAVVFVQPFRPFASGKFGLLGAPMVVVGGKTLASSQAEPLVSQIIAGVQAHSKAAESWEEWCAA